MSEILTYNFCEDYLKKLVDYIEKNYVRKDKDLSRLAICFGGRRPQLFLKQKLAKKLKAGFYPPKFFAIDELITYINEKSQSCLPINDLNSCYLIYTLAKNIAPQILEKRQSFEKFLPWAREILDFIDQLDLENIDDKRLLNIKANAEIGYDVPEDINRLLKHILVLRHKYHAKLDELNLTSRGLQYWKASQDIDKISFEEFDQILFCNFFYFHRTEELVVKNLYNRQKATLIFQGDERKWSVLKRIAKNFDCKLNEADEPPDPQFNLKLYSGFDTHSQVGVVREILKEIKNPDKTIIVLPNADSLVPLLTEISTVTEDFNVSLGYPVGRSSLYSLCELIFQAQFSRKQNRYYTRDYLKALGHPFVKNLKLAPETSVTRILVHKLEEILTGKEETDISGSSFIDLKNIEELDALYSEAQEMIERLGVKLTKEKIKEVLKTLHEIVFKSWEPVENFLSFSKALKGFLDVLVKNSFISAYPLNINIVEKFYAIADDLAEVSFKDEPLSSHELFKIFSDKIAREMISFHGSPLKGLQVLGLFETRSLNFENVIILDVNESSLPSLAVHEPLIPREIMISLGLDRLELDEEIQRYQFMRLISSAQNVHLIYQQSKDKERSRFIEELIWKQEKDAKTLNVLQAPKASFEVAVSSKKKTVPKTPAIISFLKNRTYSASSVNMYLKNPMEFYYSYVLGLKEQDDLLDEPEARHIGTFVHELLEDAFKPFLGKVVKIDDAFRKRFFKKFEERFEATLSRSMKSDAFLLKSVMIERLTRLLDYEEENLDRQGAQILYLENAFENVISLPSGNFKFKYIVDRIDQLADGSILLLDYKTGSADQVPRAITQISSMELSRKTIYQQVKSFQIPLYFYYMTQQFPGRVVNAGLYSLRALDIQKLITDKMNYDYPTINQAFLRALDFVMKEILDPDVPFIEDKLDVW
ncbi:MAG: PD-(D/E)XK nuclease family protein [Candidatus Omnitrophica bacterium]|nr:PD-(D/E)XK nuclease family protein [Candidatus Omnitrophota bacterium]